MLASSHTLPTGSVPVITALHHPQAGSTAVSSRMRENVIAIALRGERLMADTHMPSAREKKSVLNATRAMRANSPPVTPPSKTGNARIGTTASTAYSPLTEVAASLPNTTS